MKRAEVWECGGEQEKGQHETFAEKRCPVHRRENKFEVLKKEAA